MNPLNVLLDLTKRRTATLRDVGFGNYQAYECDEMSFKLSIGFPIAFSYRYQCNHRGYNHYNHMADQHKLILTIRFVICN